MRIVIDMQGAQTESRFRGVGRYSLSLSMAIARNAGHHEIWLVLNAAFPDSIMEIRYAFKDIIPLNRIRIFDLPQPIAEKNSVNINRTKVAELIREFFINQFNPDIILITSLFEGYVDDAATSIGSFFNRNNTVVVLHDLIPYLRPDIYLPDDIQKEYYYRKIESLKKAGMMLANSDYTRREAIDNLHINESAIYTISAAIDECFRPLVLSKDQVDNLYHKYRINKKIVLYVPGGFDIRKNFEYLIHAFAQLPNEIRRDYQLVIVSMLRGSAETEITHIRKEAGLVDEELIITDYIPDSDLIMLYNLATLFVFPSLYEGFGLPPLEAMACGAPTIGSDTTSIREVIGWADALFDPTSVDSISKKMKQALTDEEFRIKLSSHGLNQSKKFSWHNSANKAIAAMELLNERNLDQQSNEKKNSDDLSRLIESIGNILKNKKPTSIELMNIASVLAFDSANEANRQLLVDVSEFVKFDAKSGIQRVVRHILSDLLKNPPIGYYVRPVYYENNRYYIANQFTSHFLENPVPSDSDPVAEFNQFDVYLALDLSPSTVLAAHNLHTRFSILGVHMFFVVYDLLLVQRPDWWPTGNSVVFENWLKSISMTATGLICISESVANELRIWMNHNPPKRLSKPEISSFQLGADFKKVNSVGIPENGFSIIERLKKKPSFLMVGTVEPRKGYAQTLASFDILWKDGIDINLVIVGKKGWLVDELSSKIKNHCEYYNRLFWFEGISDEFLEKLFSVCICLIAASEGEGFGLPLIEAAYHKMPIIARDLAVFHEVAGDYASYFNGLEPENLSLLVKKWLELWKQGNIPKSDNMPYISWSESSSQLRSLMKLDEYPKNKQYL